MSYHSNTSRMTELQLDRWADTANEDRTHVASGRTIFVDVTASYPSPCPDPLHLCPTGSSTKPYPTIQEGVDAAGSTDIGMLRAGIYPVGDDPVVIDSAILRATSVGSAIIGASH